VSFGFRLRKFLEHLHLSRRGGRERLVRHYFFFSVILLAGGLISSGLVEIYFRYQENLEQLTLTQQDAAVSTSLKIERFIQDVVTTMKATTKSRDITANGILPTYEFELKRLLFLEPAITEATALSSNGVMRAQTSRFRAVSPDAGKDFSTSAAFRQSKQGKPYFGAAYFREFEPYMTIAVPIEYSTDVIGVLKAELSLRDVWDIISATKVGKAGYAYTVTRSGDLIAHPNIRLVLEQKKVVLDQLKEAFQPSQGGLKARAIIAYNLQGQKVFSSHALIPILDWAVFVERPVEDAHEPLYASMLRTSSLLLVGLGLALLASLYLARRVVRPLQALREGVERISSGDLSSRLEIKTGDEIETLAEEFNKMTAHLKEAQTGLERKVAERTQALTVANEKLEEASKLKSQFLANVNHELRTPVSAIIGYARLVLRATEGQISQLQKENLQDLLHNGERLLNQIDSLLEFSKIEAGKMEMHVEPVGLNEVIQGAVSTIEPTLNGAYIRIIREIGSDLPALNTDREKLRQIVLNLLDNAVKFTERGEIKIATSQQNGSLKLVVSDTGIGIPKEELNKIFEEFHRGDSSGNRNYRGTGLGLAIVKKFVNLLGGEVAVESELGKGSVFTVTLPLDSTMKPLDPSTSSG
jgi:signal transduction histidine kinase